MSLLNWPTEKPNWFRASGSDSPTPGLAESGSWSSGALGAVLGCVWWRGAGPWRGGGGVAAGGGRVFIPGWGGLGLGLARGCVSVWVRLCLFV